MFNFFGCFIGTFMGSFLWELFFLKTVGKKLEKNFEDRWLE